MTCPTSNNWEKEFSDFWDSHATFGLKELMYGDIKSFIRKLLDEELGTSNKVWVKILMTCEQRKDFMWAINDILRLGALNQGRAAQLLAIDYKSGHYEKPTKIKWYEK